MIQRDVPWRYVTRNSDIIATFDGYGKEIEVHPVLDIYICFHPEHNEWTLKGYNIAS